MKIPKRLKIGPYTYVIVKRRECRLDGKEVMGYCDRDKRVIYLATTMDKEKEKEVFIHECLHAIEDSYGLSLGENKVNVLGLSLKALIDDNKLRLL